MTDYTKATGSGGLLMIRDTGSSVEMYVKAGSTGTWFNGGSYQVFVNGAYKTGSFNYPSGANWLLLYSEAVSSNQSVELYIGATGTSGMGGPTDFWQAIPRATAPQVDSYRATAITAHSFTTTGLHVFNYTGTLIDTMLEVNTTQTPGVGQVQLGAFGDMYVGGLARATNYYFRMRVADNTYGWGSWNGWVLFSTLYENPSPPGTSVDQIMPTTARIVVSPPADDGGAAIDAYGAYVLSNNAWPGQGGNVVASAAGGTFTATGLMPSTQYYYTANCHNAAGLWSAVWTPMKAFSTLPSAKVNVGGVQKDAIPYVCISPDVWKLAVPYKNRGPGWWTQ